MLGLLRTILALACVTGVTWSSWVSKDKISTTTPNAAALGYNYDSFYDQTFYMDNSSYCSGTSYGWTHYFSSSYAYDYVEAWETIPHTAVPQGCVMTIASYSDYGLNWYFVGESFINSSDVTLDIYEGVDTNGDKIVS